MTLGTNIEYAVDENGILTIKINTKKRGERSKSGKSVIIATTSGNVAVPGTDIVLGLNAYVKA